MKPYHLVGFLFTVIIITCLMYPWSKNNVKDLEEGFEEKEQSGFNLNQEFENLFNYVLKSRRMAKKYEQRIKALKSQLKNRGTVRIDDYKKILSDISEIIDNEYNPERAAFILKQDAQNIEMEKLAKEAELLQKKIQIKGVDKIDRHAIGSIKSLDSGVNMNVKQLKNKDLILKNDEKSKIFSDDRHPLMVHLNNGCLSYEANGKYGSQHCEMQNPKQYMVYRLINNRYELNKHIADPELKVSEETDIPRLYPFNIITPYHNEKMCIQADQDGLSVEDCRPLASNNQQKWVDYALPRAGCSKNK